MRGRKWPLNMVLSQFALQVNWIVCMQRWGGVVVAETNSDKSSRECCGSPCCFNCLKAPKGKHTLPPQHMSHDKTWPLLAFRMILTGQKSTQFIDYRVNEKSTFFHWPCLFWCQFLTRFLHCEHVHHNNMHRKITHSGLRWKKLEKVPTEINV